MSRWDVPKRGHAQLCWSNLSGGRGLVFQRKGLKCFSRRSLLDEGWNSFQQEGIQLPWIKAQHSSQTALRFCLLDVVHILIGGIMSLQLEMAFVNFCTAKFIKTFLPFQKMFTFCCWTECQLTTICRPCYRICAFFCETLGFVLLSRIENNLSIKLWVSHLTWFVWWDLL